MELKVHELVIRYWSCTSGLAPAKTTQKRCKKSSETQFKLCQWLKDNERRIDKEDDFEKTDFIMNRLKENNKFYKYEIGEALYSQLFNMVKQKKKLNNMLKREN